MKQNVAPKFRLLHIPSGRILLTSYGDLWLKTFLHSKNKSNNGAWRYWHEIVENDLGYSLSDTCKEEFEIIELKE